MQSPRTDWLNTKALTITHVFYPVSQLIYHREREEGWQAERPRAFIHCGNQTCALHSDLRFAYTAEANQPGAQSIYPLCIIICASGTAAHSHRVALSCWVSERASECAVRHANIATLCCTACGPCRCRELLQEHYPGASIFVCRRVRGCTGSN
jgi:hypothetical protein